MAGALMAALSCVPALAAGPAPGELPTGAAIMAGQAQINRSGTVMTVNQTTARAAINWNSFSIGKDATVNFVQPNASAVALNRVTGAEASVINGALNANGQVFILNPNGVLFGQNARVDTAGLVASTLNLSDADFMAGKTTFNGQGGSVSNQGQLNARDGGYVALLGAQVLNDGVITARLGTVVLASGNKVSLKFAGDALVGVTVDEAALGALVANGQAIRADGGTVILTAKGADSLMDAMVNNTGEIRARTIGSKAGKIYLLGEGGAVEVAGRLDASAPETGNGGFIETSAPVLRVVDGAQIDTRSQTGANGSWLIDPTDFTIGAGSAPAGISGIGASTLQAALAAGNVTIQTQASGSEAGNINVNSAVAWNANKLTLEAHGDINVNAVMSATGTSSLDLKTGYNFNVGSPGFDNSKHVRVGISNGNSFTGRIDFDRAGTGILAINGQGYTLINALGSAGSTTTTDLQGINGSGGGRYALASNIDASATGAWNSGAGFGPLAFSGVFDGLGHTVDGFHINQPSGSYVGMFGTNHGVVRNVGMTNAMVTGNQGVGALIGLNMGSAINVFSSGQVSAPGGYVGGLIGAIFDGQIDNVHSSGSVTSAGNNVGGLTGYLAYQITLSNSSSRASVTNSAGVWTGGLVGQNDYGRIRDSFASGTVIGKGDTGGLVGNNNSGLVTGSHASGSVTGTTNTGGLIGNNNNGRVNGSYATGAVGGMSTVGGLIGLTSASGGTATPDNSITQSYATGAVNGSGDNVGGLIGRSYGNAVSDTYARGAVSSSGNYVGGLVGNNLGTIANSYSTGAVSGPGVGVGGLIGVSIGGVTNSFWDVQTSGQNSSGDGLGRTTAQMKDAALFTGGGWNFTFHSGVWGRKDTLNDGYPVLRAFGYTDPIVITLDNASLSKFYGAANPLLGSSGWSVSGCDNNLSCLAGIDWGSALSSTTAVGSYSYSMPNLLALTFGSGYGKASDYDITINPGTLTVNKAVLTVAGTNVDNKTYDGTTAASVHAGTIVGLANGENLTLSGTGAFGSANAGNYNINVLLSLANGSGPNAGLLSNYEWAGGTVLASATITPRTLDVTAIDGASRAYDGTATAAANLLQLSGLLPSDSASLAGHGALSGSVGMAAVVGKGSLTLDNANYTLAGAVFRGVVNIAAAPVPPQPPLSPPAVLPVTTVLADGPGSRLTDAMAQASRAVVPELAEALPEKDVPTTHLSQLHVVEGGVRLPEGADQSLFVVNAR